MNPPLITIICTTMLSSLFMVKLQSQTMVQINASDVHIQYTGRYDRTDPDKILMSYPGVSIKARFQGTTIDAIFKERGAGGAQTSNHFYVIIDGGSPTKLKLSPSQTVYPLANGLANTEHTVELFKLTESSVGQCEFLGFQLEQGQTLLTPAARPTRRIEFIGNSMTCGYGNEVNYTAAQLNTKWGFNAVNENNYKAWGAITCRNLQAEYMCTAYSGRGLYMNNTGTTTGTMPLMYDFTIPDQTVLTWDHTRYTPDVIVINLGTNDFAAEATGIAQTDETAYKTAYISFIDKLRGYYPDARIVCAVGCMMTDWYPAGKQHWTRIQSYVTSVVTQFNAGGDAHVYYHKLEPQSAPYGEDWHPSTATHQAMAASMTTFIKSITGWTDTTSASGIGQHAKKHGVDILRLTEHQLLCNMDRSGHYQVNIFHTDGRLAYAGSAYLTNGANEINLDSLVNKNELYVVQIANESHMQKKLMTVE